MSPPDQSRFKEHVDAGNTRADGMATDMRNSFLFACVSASAVLLAVEHRIVKPSDFSRVNAAFFTVNGVVSIFFGTLVVMDLLSR